MHRSLLAPVALVCLLALAVPAAHAQGATGTINAQDKVSVRARPGGKRVGTLRAGRTIKIACQVNGTTANGRSGRSAIWDRITYKGHWAYVADAVVDTGGTRALVAPYCGAPGVVRRVDPAATSGACAVTSPVTLDEPFTDHPAFLAAAVPGAQASDRETQVPAAVTLAQAILESGWGQFSAGANNYFGIKAQPTGETGVYEWGQIGVGCVLRKTQEEVGGRLEFQIAAFRAYQGLKDSIRDHGARLLANPVYAAAFDHTEDDERFATIIARHYATDSRYASKLISLMRKYDLERYDVTSDAAPTGSNSSGGVEG